MSLSAKVARYVTPFRTGWEPEPRVDRAVDPELRGLLADGDEPAPAGRFATSSRSASPVVSPTQ